jgi:pentatricopeptide repeat protein
MPVNLRTYNALMAALSKAARRNAKYSSKMHAPQRYPADAPLHGSIENETVDLDEEQLWTRAMDLLRQMEEDGIEPDGFSFSSAISCCGAGGKWKEALELIKIMRKGGPKTRPNKIAYTAAIGEYMKSIPI